MLLKTSVPLSQVKENLTFRDTEMVFARIAWTRLRLAR
jgi:hypothetical protein